VKSSITHVSFATWNDGAGSLYVDNVFAPPTNRYTLDVDVVGSGTVDIDPGESTYADGTNVDLTATADPGWSFSAWSGDHTGSTNPDTITMDDNKSITATFTQNEYTLTTNMNGTGTGTLDVNPAGPYHYNDVVTLWANATIGSTFTGWYGDLTGATSPDTLTITDNMIVTAEFTLQPLLVDSEFNDNSTSEQLREDSACQDWYESRGDIPTQLILNETDIGGNTGKKAGFIGSSAGNAYISQNFSSAQTSQFSVQWDIYVDKIDDISGNPDRTGWMFVGDDANGVQGPCSTAGDRFMTMAFAKDGGGTEGTMDLVGRDSNDGWTSFTMIDAGLNLNQWYTIRVDIDVDTDTYDVYVDDIYQITMNARTVKSSITHVSFATWNDGAGSLYVDNVFSPAII
jgi:uncharacterized repeat protein (TIGR02543 family)